VARVSLSAPYDVNPPKVRTRWGPVCDPLADHGLAPRLLGVYNGGLGDKMWTFALLLACRDRDPAPPVPVTEDVDVDLVSPLGPGEVRAGVITDEAALFGGISAEGRCGDLKIYNDRVRFVIQAARPGSFYLPEGGGVLDADVVRPDGVVGRDLVEEWTTMFGLGRVLVPEQVEVVADGSDGGEAVVRVTGYEGPLGLLEGALEAPGFVPPLGLEMSVEYRLRPDSWLLEVTSTATATTGPATLGIGDMLMGSDELVSPWLPGTGLASAGGEPRPWSGYVADRNDVAMVIAAPAGAELELAGAQVLTELASMVLGFGPSVTLEPGDSVSWTRLWGVGPDMATLTGAVLEARGEPTQQVEGTVTAADGPVAGARVVVDVDGAPYTAAVTRDDGTFLAAVPPGEVALLAEGRGPAMFLDLPPGAASVSAYSAAPVREQGLAALRDGAVAVPLAQGRGVGTPDDPLVLGVPATLSVASGDGLPFTVRVRFVEPDAPTDEARVPARPDGLAAAGWARDGAIELPVEPGTYDVLVHRGPRYELHEERITLEAGARVEVSASLPAAFAHPGWVLGDPHSHAAPSPDSSIPMEDRLIVAGAVGFQVHFGTDHDHLADYRPLLAPLGLEGVLRSVVADEVSPPVRGHFNIYPVTPDPEQPNNGAWLWWTEIPESTEGFVARLRERHGQDFVLQVNHPTDNGMASAAGWSPGAVSRPDFWTDEFEAIEVLNSGEYDDFLPLWIDLTSRGHRAAPIGVSDSHSHFRGHLGWSATWLQVGTDDPVQTTDEALAASVREGRVVAMRGPFLEVDPLPGATVAPGAEVSVTVKAASWVRVDRLRLLRDGVEAQVVEGTSATFALEPEADAWYAVIAEGDEQMQPVTSDTPWALAGPWRVDVGGDGWTPPLPPLQ
jgi:hypothetical protein